MIASLVSVEVEASRESCSAFLAYDQVRDWNQKIWLLPFDVVIGLDSLT